MKKIYAFLFSLSMIVAAQAQVLNYNVGETVADFTVTDTDGVTHNLYEYTSAGKYVILDFFFVACVPCQQTTPIFNELHDKYGCNAGDLICISMNSGSDTDAQVVAFEEEFGGSFNHAAAVSAEGGAGAVTSNFGIAAYPTFTLIGPDNGMLETDIWPIANLATFEATFPNGSGIEVMACSVGVDEVKTGMTWNGVYPNPTQGITTMSYTLKQAATVRIALYNLIGEKIAIISNNTQVAGEHNVNFDFSAYPSGIYMLVSDIGGRPMTHRVVVR